MRCEYLGREQIHSFENWHLYVRDSALSNQKKATALTILIWKAVEPPLTSSITLARYIIRDSEGIRVFRLNGFLKSNVIGLVS